MDGGTIEEDGSLSWEDFKSIDELIRYTEVADIGWISFRYLISLAQRGERLPCRQEVPPEAFYDRKSIGIFSIGPPRRGINFGTSRAIVVSHAWWSKDHPDPDGRQVRALVKHMEPALDQINKRYGDHSDIPVFWDFASLYQHPRTASQEKAFQRAVSDMHLLYAHRLTCVVQLEGVPDDAPNPTPYDDRGWTTLEQTIARAKTAHSGATPPERVGLDGAPATPKNPSTAGHLPFLMPCDRFDEVLLGTKVFSYRSDTKVVSQLYRTVAPALAAGQTSIDYEDSIDDNAVGRLVEALPMYTNLMALSLQDAKSITTAGGLAAIVNLLLEQQQTNPNTGAQSSPREFRYLPELEYIYFMGFCIGREGLDLLRRLHQLRPSLQFDCETLIINNPGTSGEVYFLYEHELWHRGADGARNYEVLWFSVKSVTTVGLAAIVDPLLERVTNANNSNPPPQQEEFRYFPGLLEIGLGGYRVDQEGQDLLGRLKQRRPKLRIEGIANLESRGSAL